jgi:cardiolipin synthase
VSRPDEAGASSGSPSDGLDRILTVPNVLSVVRLCCIPVFVYLLFGRESRFGAALLLAVLGATDWVDGFIARRFDQVSTLGKVLDPVADRLLLGVAIVCILVDGSVPAVVAWLVIAREGLVSLGVLGLAALGGRRIDVSFAGKAGTFALMVAFPLFLVAADDNVSWRGGARVAAWVFAVVGLLVSYYAAATYVPEARRALRDRRQAHAGDFGGSAAG